MKYDVTRNILETTSSIRTYLKIFSFRLVLTACLATFVSITEQRDVDDAAPDVKLIGTGYCGRGRLAVCNVNFDIETVCGIGFTL